jgi:hypothetical protein
MSVLQEQNQPDLEELEGFSWWFGSGRFDADWALLSAALSDHGSA